MGRTTGLLPDSDPNNPGIVDEELDLAATSRA
jgi:hypothetical protein